MPRPVPSTEIFTFSESLAARLETVMVRAGRFRNCSGTEKLVRAVGIENTTGRNFKELEGMLGNVKALKSTGHPFGVVV